MYTVKKITAKKRRQKTHGKKKTVFHKYVSRSDRPYIYGKKNDGKKKPAKNSRQKKGRQKKRKRKNIPVSNHPRTTSSLLRVRTSRRDPIHKRVC
jgi:hypothetical protein